MPNFRVYWSIDVNAESAEQAAQEVANACFKKHIAEGQPDSACFFTVVAQSDLLNGSVPPTAMAVSVDLEVVRKVKEAKAK